MSLMVIDVDHSKNINDTYGDNAEDKVLISISNILKQHVRNGDIVGRWGGEEFIILVPTATALRCEAIADKIRVAIEDGTILDDIKVTASFGITQIKLQDTLEESFGRADGELYEAKNSRRNNIKIKL